MKTTEQIFNEHLNPRFEGNLDLSLDELKAIRLEDLKEGMRRASDVCNFTNLADGCEAATAIITAADQLTEKDL